MSPYMCAPLQVQRVTRVKRFELTCLWLSIEYDDDVHLCP